MFSEHDQNRFHVLVATPEKLQLVVRNKSIERPLALIVMDEAHNIEDEDRTQDRTSLGHHQERLRNRQFPVAHAERPKCFRSYDLACP